MNAMTSSTKTFDWTPTPISVTHTQHLLCHTTTEGGGVACSMAGGCAVDDRVRFPVGSFLVYVLAGLPTSTHGHGKPAFIVYPASCEADHSQPACARFSN